MVRWTRRLGTILAAVILCSACAVQRVPIGAGPSFLRSTGLARVSDLRAVGRPAWAPDGRHLVFSTADALWSVAPQVGDVDRRRIAQIAGAERVAWSPDGRTVTALVGGRLVAISLDDPSPRPLAPIGGVLYYAWPPAGRTIFGFGGRAGSGPALASSGPTGVIVWTVRPDLPRAVRIGSLARGLDLRGLTWLSGRAGVALAAGRRGGAVDRIVFISPDTRTAPRVQMLPAGGHDPVPSPDGRLIAYLDGAGAAGALSDDETRVAVMRADGSGRRDLTEAGRNGALAWSPAATLLAYTKDEGDHAVLAIVDVLTGERMRIGDYYGVDAGSSRAPLAIVWAPDGTRLAVGMETAHGAGFISMITLERR